MVQRVHNTAVLSVEIELPAAFMTKERVHILLFTTFLISVRSWGPAFLNIFSETAFLSVILSLVELTMASEFSVVMSPFLKQTKNPQPWNHKHLKEKGHSIFDEFHISLVLSVKTLCNWNWRAFNLSEHYTFNFVVAGQTQAVCFTKESSFGWEHHPRRMVKLSCCLGRPPWYRSRALLWWSISAGSWSQLQLQKLPVDLTRCPRWSSFLSKFCKWKSFIAFHTFWKAWNRLRGRVTKRAMSSLSALPQFLGEPPCELQFTENENFSSDCYNRSIWHLKSSANQIQTVWL